MRVFFEGSQTGEAFFLQIHGESAAIASVDYKFLKIQKHKEVSS